MDGQLYFEQRPWDFVVQKLQAQDAGEIVSISAQVVCLQQKLNKTVATWKDRFASLLGKCEREDVQETEGVFSMIARYPGGTVVRLFIDEGAEQASENFEIATKNSLIVWNPGMSPQGYVVGEKACFYDCSQPYSVQLEVK